MGGVSLINGHIDDDVQEMTDNEIKKATENDIIKALEDWLKNFEGKAVDYMKIRFALNLINRQKAEIENYSHNIKNLTAENMQLQTGITRIVKNITKKDDSDD